MSIISNLLTYKIVTPLLLDSIRAMVGTLRYFIVLVAVACAITSEPKLIVTLLKSGFVLLSVMVERRSACENTFLFGI